VKPNDLGINKNSTIMDTQTLSEEHGLFQTMVTLARWEKIARHKHCATHETCCVVTGKAEITLGGRSFSAQKGVFFSIPAHTPHQISNIGRFPLKILSSKSKNDPEDTFPC
jgi:quercetin dioxygenase-like cupin family protein